MTALVLPRESLTTDSKLAKILACLGWKVVVDSGTKDDRPIRIWHSDEVHDKSGWINHRRTAIDKARVNEVFEQVFHYPIGVTPHNHHGLVIEKIPGHQKHGKVVECPRMPKSGYVYQKLITNHPKESWLEEWRIDLFGNSCLITRKQLDKDSNGFPGPERRVGMFTFDVPIEDAFTDPEILRLALFARKIGMEYGSLDALRDLDNRLYIIDATTVTACPNPIWHGNVTEHMYVKRSAEKFKEAFGR